MTTHLTDTQKQTIRIALARWRGWRPHTTNEKIPGIWWPPTAPKVQGLPHFDNCEEPPNYPASLDACHEIEVKLTDEEHSRFRKHLENLTWVELRPSETCRNYVSASAEHRSLALFRALKLGELGD